MDERTFYEGPTGIEGVSTTQWIEIRDESLYVWAQDLGRPLEQIFGDDEHEWFLEMPADGTAPLLAALLADRFGGGPGAKRDFEKWALQRGLKFRKVVIP